LKKQLKVLFGAALTASFAVDPAWAQQSTSPQTDAYNPVISPADFVPGVNHKYFTLKPGKKFSYQKSDGSEQVEIVITRDTKTVMGVSTIVVREIERKGEVVEEDSRNWFAQDKQGNVWYFGEAVEKNVGGKLTKAADSWEAGVDGSKPGMIMVANPKVGDTYHQEYYKGHAEDMGTVVALGRKVATPAGTFDDCVQIKDWSNLETSSEYKYFCSGIGFMVMEESTRPGGARLELVRISDE
jgi:hypothetical protein